jgi:hypothetical protein
MIGVGQKTVLFYLSLTLIHKILLLSGIIHKKTLNCRNNIVHTGPKKSGVTFYSTPILSLTGLPSTRRGQTMGKQFVSV